ncbi:hypothetical protein Pla52o_35520 [Novipirellula galeiformis]|uniref:Uncharacterized protein n=1 Tax=Novipirellula galeiformis TaxID=2528004 RepID=A0A5C6CEQ1_9BACT|nr:hypothetical protein [Novipirellula galeiformis]TWU22495.1 hypothetical protein Pla52o_35520 [Novipirellula galeiformis]
MKPRLYGFKIDGPNWMTVPEFCKSLAAFNNRRFKHGGKYRRAFVRQHKKEWLVTFVTESEPRDQIIEQDDHEVHDHQPSVLYRKESSENLPKTREVTCLLFCERRKTGVVATYRGGFSVLAICGWIAKEYRSQVSSRRDDLENLQPEKQRKKFRKEHSLKNAVSAGPITKSTALAAELNHIREFLSIEAYVPEQPADPGDVLRPLSNHVRVHVAFNAKARQNKKKSRLSILNFIKNKSVSKGTVVGLDEEGIEQRIHIDEERAFALGSIEYDTLVDEEHLNQNPPADAKVFEKLREFMTKNPGLFGA